MNSLEITALQTGRAIRYVGPGFGPGVPPGVPRIAHTCSTPGNRIVKNMALTLTMR
jgi:hypothetical protein